MKHLFKYAVTHGGSVKMLDGSFANSLGISNPAVLKHKNKYYMTFRSCEYSFFNFFYNCKDFTRRLWYPLFMYEHIPCKFLSKYHICEFDPHELKIKNPKKIFEDREKRELFYNGVEDIRLWHDKDGNIGMNYSMFESDGTVSMNFSIFDDDLNEMKTVKHNFGDFEKNWMPVDGRPEFWVRKPFNDIVYGFDKLQHIGDPDAPLRHRGSTNLCEYNDGYICLVHGRIETKINEIDKDFKYAHKFVIVDKNFAIQRQSDWFSFAGFPIEFTCGMMIENNKLILPMCVFDSVSFVISIGMDEIMAFIENRVINTVITGVDLSNKDLHKVILNSDDDTLTSNLCEYIINVQPYNKSAMISCKTQLGATVSSKADKLKWYIETLCEIKKFDIGMENKFMHMLVGEDMIRDVIDKLIN